MKQLFRFSSFLFLMVGLLTTTFAQSQYHKWGVGIGFNFRDFEGVPNGEWSETDFKPAFRFTVGRYLNPSFDLMLENSWRPFRERASDIDGLTDLDLDLRYKFNNGYILKEDAVLAPYLSAGIGTNVVEWANPKFDMYAPLGLGFRIQAAPQLNLDFSALYKKSLTDFQDYFTLNAGVGINIGKGNAKVAPEPEPDPDRDGDGIVDVLDECPDTPGVAELKGCPDKDGDMIADKDDDCPDVPGLKELAGCPDLDADDDGIVDEEDACPNTPGLVSLKGCPDKDGDQIADKDDECPEVAGLAEFNGCPDTDADGITDAEDACPEEAGVPELKGCPEVAEEVIEKLEYATKSVQFESGKDVLRTISYPVLDSVVAIMNQYPAYSLKASGHTDSIGEADDNQDLSERRAKACVDYLISKGVPQERLTFIGYGESQPIADNMYRPGRAKNRRVEFELFVK